MLPLLLALLAPAPEDPCVHDPTVLGCPLPDRDGDGLLDLFDWCRDNPENFQGHQDDDGCPDEPPGCTPPPSQGYLTNISFAPNDARVRGRALHALAGLAAELRRFGAHFDIRGRAHPHEGRSPAERLELSRRRAEAVYVLLVALGVDAARLTTSALGDSEAYGPSKTAAQRRRHTRIGLFMSRSPIPRWFTPLPWDP